MYEELPNSVHCYVDKACSVIDSTINAPPLIEDVSRYCGPD